MNPTPRDRFQGALMGSLLGPIYDFHYAQPGNMENHAAPKPLRPQPGPLSPPTALLHKYWIRLATAGEAALQSGTPGCDESEPLDISGLNLSTSSLEEQLLNLLPEVLLRTSWLSEPHSLGQNLGSSHSLSSDYPSDFRTLLAEVNSHCQKWSEHGELALVDWLYSYDEALREQSSLANLGAIQRRLGAQLVALNLGSRQGPQGFPWATKAWLGEWYFPLLHLGDRLYAAWSGQTDLEKLGVSCEGSLIMATPII